MCTQTALNTWPRVVLPLMPVIAERAAETAAGGSGPMTRNSHRASPPGAMPGLQVEVGVTEGGEEPRVRHS